MNVLIYSLAPDSLQHLLTNRLNCKSDQSALPFCESFLEMLLNSSIKFMPSTTSLRCALI